MTTSKYFVRSLQPQNEPLIWQFLLIAAHETQIESVRENSKLALYAEDWGRVGDSGFVAIREEGVVGAVWWRLWNGKERGFGFVDEETPEIAIGVLPKFQNQGIGSALLKRATEERGRLSLNVRSDSAAVRLYRRFGFGIVAGSESENRVGGMSFTMLRC